MLAEKIGRYRLLNAINEGGMATVYLARDPLFERDVAIKLLPVDLVAHPTLRPRFEREAKVVAALDHPALVSVYDFGEQNGQPYLVMRYMQGGSLAERLDQGALSLEEAARILLRLADALDVIHAQGIIHRDLKPGNILFDQWGEPFLADFGAAKPTTKNDAYLTSVGSAVGTPAYMSPEQIQGKEDIDGRSDIYAMGIILYEMISGSHPYETDSPMGVIVEHITKPVPRILDDCPNLPPAIQDAIAKALAKEKTERYATALEFATAVQRAIYPEEEAMPPSTATIQSKATAAAPSKHAAKRRWAGIIALLIMSVLVLIGGRQIGLSGRWAAAASPGSAAVVFPEETPSPAPTNAPTLEATATAPAPTVTAVAQQIVNPSPAPSLTPTAVSPPTATPTPTDQAVAAQASSIFAEPDTESEEFAVVDAGETLAVLGRSETGNWLYVENGTLTQGFIFAPRLEWSGDFDALPVFYPRLTPTPTAAPSSPCDGNCPALEFDLYPLPNGRCENNLIYMTVYMEGRGGDGRYRYFWNNEQIGGPIAEGIGFEVSNINGPLVIGTGKITSGNGQTIEKELYISEFNCE